MDSCTGHCGTERTDTAAAVIGDADFQWFVQQRALHGEQRPDSRTVNPSCATEDRDGISDFIFCLAAADEPQRGLLEHGIFSERSFSEME